MSLRSAAVVVAALLAARLGAQSTTEAPPTAPPKPTPNQSLIEPLGPVGYARQAQADFEKTRREALGFSSGGAYAEPDVQFGSIFYWNNNNDVPPRPELPEIGVARRRLLQTLVAAAQATPTDDWVAGQRVKYSIEAKDFAGASRRTHGVQGHGVVVLRAERLREALAERRSWR